MVFVGVGGAARRTGSIMLQPFLPRKQLGRCALGSSDVVLINLEQHECEKEGAGGGKGLCSRTIMHTPHRFSNSACKQRFEMQRETKSHNPIILHSPRTHQAARR